MSYYAWAVLLVALALAAPARTSPSSSVPPAEDPPPRERLTILAAMSPLPDGRLHFEDYTSTNNLGDGAQFYASGSGGFREARPTRSRRSLAVSPTPALDAVEDSSSQRWSIHSHGDKPRFVTSKAGRGPGTGAKAALTSDNEVADRSRSAEPTYQLPDYDTSRDYLYRDAAPVDDFLNPPPRKRIVYYANLPEVVRHGPDYAPGDYRSRGYAVYPGPYPRDYAPSPVAISSGDRFTYVPGGRNSYAIIDAAPPASPGYYDPGGKYSRIPAPYQGPQADRFYYARPDYVDGRQYGGRSREAVRPSSPPTSGYRAPLAGDGPYRDYNPRQPAPWSMQVGTRLMVNDDGRPMAPLTGRPGRPYYVESQRSGYPSRYARADDVLS